MDDITKLSKEIAAEYDKHLLFSARIKMSFGDEEICTTPEPAPKQTLRQRLNKWLRATKENIAQTVHDWSTKRGAYCSCDCGDW